MKTIYLAVLWFADADGDRWLYGGMEKWCRDIAFLCASKGYFVEIFQKANRRFTLRLSDNIKVTGFPCGLSRSGHYKYYRQLTQQLAPDSPVCFVSKELALGNYFKNAIGIDHGIWWDGDNPFWKLCLNKFFQYRLIQNFGAILSVDTNYINWCHAELPNRKLWRHKLHYLPNYVDTARFTKIEGNQSLPIKILFPRRTAASDDAEKLMNHNRGAGLLLQAARILLRNKVDFKLIFCGRDSAGGSIAKYAKEYGFAERITATEVPFDDMAGIYSQASVVVIPSIAHEGTSLAAIESIAMGIPTVVTHIGGLGNLVIPGHNGFVSDLSPESLADAIMQASRVQRLEPEVCDSFRRALGKERWEKQVWDHFTTFLRLGP